MICLFRFYLYQIKNYLGLFVLVTVREFTYHSIFSQPSCSYWAVTNKRIFNYLCLIYHEKEKRFKIILCYCRDTGLSFWVRLASIDVKKRSIVFYLSHSKSWLQVQSIMWLSTVNTAFYYSTIMSFYHIRSREQPKYEAVIHCSVLV